MMEYLKAFICHILLGFLLIFVTGGVIVYGIAFLLFLDEYLPHFWPLFLVAIFLCWLVGWIFSWMTRQD